MIKDLPPEDVPEFFKDILDGKAQFQPKMSTKELMMKVNRLFVNETRTQKMNPFNATRKLFWVILLMKVNLRESLRS